MSAIDCGNVVHVADYYDIATYWPVEEQDRKAVTNLPHDAGKVLTKNDIVIGGGSGEHPAMVINIDYAISTLASILDDKYFCIDGYVDKGSWSVKDLWRVHEKMKLDENSDWFECTILMNIATFVIAELPLEYCIVNEEVLKYAQEKRKDIPWEYFNGFTAVFNSCKYGRTTVPDTNSPSGRKVIWGYSLEEWYNDNGGRK